MPSQAPSNQSTWSSSCCLPVIGRGRARAAALDPAAVVLSVLPLLAPSTSSAADGLLPASRPVSAS